MSNSKIHLKKDSEQEIEFKNGEIEKYFRFGLEGSIERFIKDRFSIRISGESINSEYDLSSIDEDSEDLRGNEVSSLAKSSKGRREVTVFIRKNQGQ